MKSEGLWSAGKIAQALQMTTDAVWWAESVAIDSRTLKPGALYVALKGERVDGHNFVKHALENGAVAAIVDRPVEGVDGERLIIVENTETALRLLAKAARARTKAKVVGITGSIGKTTTKEMIALMLKGFGRTFFTYGNLNNHLGVPLTLANMPEETEFAVIEMGMNHEGEIAQLTHQVKPDVAVITTVEAVHLEFFESVQHIAQAKAEIFMGLKLAGVAVLNKDNQYYDLLAKAAQTFQASQIVSFGQSPDADVVLKKVVDDDDGSTIHAEAAGSQLVFSMQASGDGPVYAALASLGVAMALNLDVPTASQALQEFTEVDGRGRLLPVLFRQKSMWWMDDSYNAGPASMKASLKKLASFAARNPHVKRSVAVLGDMLELGEQSEQFHQQLAHEIMALKINQVYAAGPMMKQLMMRLPETIRAAHVNVAEELVDILKENLQDGDAVVFKGSHGSKIYHVVEMLKQNN